MKCLRTFSAHISLFLALPHLWLQFLLLLDAASVADALSAKVYSNTLINESFLWGNSTLPGNRTLTGQLSSEGKKRGKEK